MQPKQNRDRFIVKEWKHISSTVKMVLYGETSPFDTLGDGFGNSSIRKTVRDEGGFTVSSSRAPVKDEGGFTSSSSRAPMKIDSIASAQSIAHGLKRCV